MGDHAVEQWPVHPLFEFIHYHLVRGCCTVWKLNIISENWELTRTLVKPSSTLCSLLLQRCHEPQRDVFRVETWHNYLLRTRQSCWWLWKITGGLWQMGIQDEIPRPQTWVRASRTMLNRQVVNNSQPSQAQPRCSKLHEQSHDFGAMPFSCWWQCWQKPERSLEQRCVACRSQRFFGTWSIVADATRLIVSPVADLQGDFGWMPA